MKVRDLLKQEIDIDVYDDVCEELGIAFCGPLELTEEGKKHFREALGLEVTFRTGTWCGDIALVHVDDEDEKVWKRRLRKAKELFESAAGYCTVDEFNRWFVEEA